MNWHCAFLTKGCFCLFFASFFSGGVFFFFFVGGWGGGGGGVVVVVSIKRLYLVIGNCCRDKLF